jgi:hypothetical protein
VSSVTTTTDAAGWTGRVVVTVTLETILGLLAAFFIGFFAPVVLAILTLASLGGRRFGLTLVAAILTVVTARLAVLIAGLAAHASMGRCDIHDDDTGPVIQLPFALAMAAQLPRWSWFWRTSVGLWWLSHFGGAALVGHAMAVAIIRQLDVATAVIAVPLAVVVHFAFLFAANLYLVLAARTLSLHPRLCVAVWRHRFLIDFLVALALVLVQAGK